MASKKEIPVTKSCGNIFADIGLPNAKELLIKAELTLQIYNRIESLGLTQVQAAKRLRLKQPDVSNLMRGRFTGFSVQRLIALLNALSVDVDIVLRPRKVQGERAGKVRVRSAVV